MEIQRGKEGMKTKMFNAEIGATAGCTLRLLLNSIPKEDKGIKHGIRRDAWFGSVDTHNQLRQDLLQLEKKWLTKNAYFPLSTTHLGMNVTDSFLLANYQKIINSNSNGSDDKKISIQRFAGMLSYQLLKNVKHLGSTSLTPSYLPEEVACPGKTVVSSDISTPSDLTEKPIIWSLVDANGKMHYLVKFDITKDPSGRCRTKKRKCKKCFENKKRRDVSFYCIS